jgi:hypothetical protein
MGRCTLSPALVFHNIVGTTFARVTDCLKRITTDGAETRTAAASAHVYRIGGVAKMKASGVLAQRSDVARSGKSKASGCQCLRIRFESHGWNAML